MMMMMATAQVTYFSPQAGPPTYFYRSNNNNNNNNNDAGVNRPNNYGNPGVNPASSGAYDESFVRYQYATPDAPSSGVGRRPAPGEYGENVIYTVPNVVPGGRGGDATGNYGGGGRPDDRYRRPNNFYDNRLDPRRRGGGSQNNNNNNNNRGRPGDRRRPSPPSTTTSAPPAASRQYSRRGCNCSPAGSVADECDYRGQCHCRPHVIGRACDRCEDNFIALGTEPSARNNGECRECDPCYRLLQPEIEKMRRRLAEIRGKIDAGGGSGAITDQNFEDALRQVTAFVEKLHRASLQTSDPSSGAVAKFRDFQNLLREIRRQVGEIVDRRLSIDDRKSTAERQAAEAKATLDRIEDLMRQLDELLRRRGRDALDDARKAEKEFGRQSQEIAAMAEESRRLAEQHEQDATGVKTTAEEALKTSRDAMQLAREAFAKQEETSRSLVQIQRGFGSIQYELDDAKRKAEDLFRRMQQCRDEARKVYDAVRRGGGAPSVNVDEVRRRSRDITRQAQSLIDVGERLKRQYGPLIESINEKVRATQEIYEEAVRLQQLLDGLLEEALSAFNIAKEAKAKADGIIAEALETLRVLRNFDNEVQESKNLADEALQQMGEIERIIVDAEGKTRTANGALVGSGQGAERALNDAAEALRIATGANGDAMNLLPEVRELGAKAAEERSRSEDLARLVDERDRDLQELENQADDNIRRAEETERISKATTSAADAGVDKAEDVLVDLERLLDKLSRIGVVNPGSLGRLGEDVADLEDQLRALNLDEQLSRLEVGAKQQQMLIDEYTLDLTQLEKDVANIQEIRGALPDGCYKNLVIESHGTGGVG